MTARDGRWMPRLAKFSSMCLFFDYVSSLTPNLPMASCVGIPYESDNRAPAHVIGLWGYTPLTPIQGDIQYIHTAVPEIKTISKQVGIPTPFPCVPACPYPRNTLAPTGYGPWHLNTTSYLIITHAHTTPIHFHYHILLMRTHLQST